MRMVPWGGSERLWHGAATHLLSQGAPVYTRTKKWSPVPRPIEGLAQDGAIISFEERHPSLTLKLLRRVSRAAYQRKWKQRIRDWLRDIDSPHVILSCGSVLDDFSELAHLSDGQVPYVVIVQAAAPEIWPSDDVLAGVTKLLVNARRVFFVSKHNQNDVQQCLGERLSNAEVVWNPVNLDLSFWAAPGGLPVPVVDRLDVACVARLDVGSKGQDILLKTLTREKWRKRDVTVTFYGEGPHRKVLENAVRYWGLERVTFQGQVDNIAHAWSKHNLGVLPSRFEGLPLAVVEAMILGRANVVPGTCGSAEVIEDNVSGFIAAAPAVDALDEALERAWQRRSDLAVMGASAAVRIRQLMPEAPCLTFANRLREIFQARSSI